MKRSEVVKELLDAYCQREGKRINTGEEKETYKKAIKIITFFEREENVIVEDNHICCGEPPF